MKDKILVFIIGLLVGAVITASGFLIYEKNNKTNNQMPNMERTQMRGGPSGETPPEKRSDSDMGNNENRPNPPSKSNDTNNNET